MINYILGGIILGITAFVIIKRIVDMKKGVSSCCGDCGKNGCHCDRKP